MGGPYLLRVDSGHIISVSELIKESKPGRFQAQGCDRLSNVTRGICLHRSNFHKGKDPVIWQLTEWFWAKLAMENTDIKQILWCLFSRLMIKMPTYQISCANSNFLLSKLPKKRTAMSLNQKKYGIHLKNQSTQVRPLDSPSVLQRTEQRLKLQTLLPCQRQRQGSESQLSKKINR